MAAFALATNDPNDLVLRGTAVPPLFTGALILPAQGRAVREAAERVTIRGGTGSVHGEHDMYFHRPITPGMEVQWSVSAYAMKQTRGGVLVTRRTLVEDLAGGTLVEHLWSNLHLGGSIDADVGAGKADHSFPETARANPVGQARIQVDRDQTFRYAGVSSDHIAHAMDDEAARQEGYSGKILQGLCTFAMCSGAVVNIGAGGDPRRLRRLAGRFSAPAYPVAIWSSTCMTRSGPQMAAASWCSRPARKTPSSSSTVGPSSARIEVRAPPGRAIRPREDAGAVHPDRQRG